MKFLLVVSFTILFCLPALTEYGQNNEIDSLKQKLLSQKEDTFRFKTLLGIAKTYFDIYQSDKALPYSEEALALSKKLNYTKGQLNALNYLGLIYLNQRNFNESLKYCVQQLDIARETGNMKEMARAYRDIGDNYATQNEQQEAMKNYMAGLTIAKEANDKVGIMWLSGSLGAYHSYNGNYAEALTYFYTSLKIAEETNDEINVGNSLDNLAYVYNQQGDYEQTIKLSLQTLELNKKLHDKRGVSVSYSRIADAYFQKGMYQEALDIYFVSLKIYHEIYDAGGAGYDIPYINNSIGNVYEKQGDSALAKGNKQFANRKYDEAKKNYGIAEELFSKSDLLAMASNDLDMGNIYMKLNLTSDAEHYFNKGIQLAAEGGHIENLKKGYGRLATLDSIRGNYKDAYAHYKLYSVYRDSLVNEETTRKSVQVKMQYEFDKKETAAKALQDKKDADARREKKIQYLVIGSLGILILAVVVIAFIQFRNNKEKQKANLLLQRQKQKVEITLQELRSAQSQLIQSEKMASLGQLTAGIAHEIQNPLNFVNNFSDVNQELVEELKNELAIGNQQLAIEIANDIKENEQKINHHGKRAESIVKGMLQHSRSSSGIKEPTDINALADEYLRLAYHGMRSKDKSFNITLQTVFDEPVGKINIIPQDIGRVLVNLYNNAFYAVNEKSQIPIAIGTTEKYEPIVSVTTKKNDDKVLISVKDNGNGIPQNIVDKIFQPFFTTKPTGQGTGLGLSLSYDIVKAHGGEIKVESKEGEGSRFIIYLPLNVNR